MTTARRCPQTHRAQTHKTGRNIFEQPFAAQAAIKLRAVCRGVGINIWLARKNGGRLVWNWLPSRLSESFGSRFPQSDAGD